MSIFSQEQGQEQYAPEGQQATFEQPQGMDTGGFESTEHSGSDVRPGDWNCSACGVNNFASRVKCFKCGTPQDGSAPQTDFQGGGGGNFQGGGNVRPGDWNCPSCNVNNFASRNACFKCGTPKLSLIHI